jgi:2'-5' RNA ligase
MNEPGPGPGTLRIGITIAVPEPFHSFLARAREQFGDKDAGRVPPHVTLLMPTLVEPGELDVLGEHLASVASSHPCFTIRLHGTGTFRPVSPVVFARVDVGASECQALSTAIRRGSLDQEQRFPYHPHVTVAQEVSDEVLDRAVAELSGFDAVFEVTQFDAYLSDDEDEWTPWRSYSLRLPDA